MSVLAAVLAAATLWGPIGYVLGVDRVLEQWERGLGARSAVRLDLRVADAGPDVPTQLRVDVHPDLGMRVEDPDGGRWVIREDRVIATNRLERAPWLPQLELFVMRDRAAFASWLGIVGVDLESNALARCGLDDCFVVGGRARTPQLWLDKETFEPRRFVSPRTGVSEYSMFRDFGRTRFPREIRVFDGDRRVANLSLLELRPAPPLAAEDFSVSWVGPRAP